MKKLRKVAPFIVCMALLLVTMIVKGSTENGKNTALQKGTHGSVNAGTGDTGSGSSEAKETAGSEGTATGSPYPEMATGEGQRGGLITLSGTTETASTDMEDTGAVVVRPTSDSDSGNYVYLGEFRITAYCACKKCCGKEKDDPDYGVTASGKYVKENWTVAADTKVLPMGSLIQIKGHIYEVQDTGSAVKGNTVDIYIPNHEDAEQFGVKHWDVFLVREGGGK